MIGLRRSNQNTVALRNHYSNENFPSVYACQNGLQNNRKKVRSSRLGPEKWKYEIRKDGIAIKIIHSDKRLEEFEILQRLKGMTHRG